MKRKILLLLLCCIGTILFPLSTFAESGYVGDEFDLNRPSVPYYATKIKSVTWSGQYASGLSCYETSSGLHVRITSYFEGSKTISCEVTYEWKSGDRTLTSTERKSYSILCLAVNLDVSNSNITLKVGQTEQINYYLSPSKGAKVTFRTSDYSVATVSSSGLVTGKSPGSATIDIEQNMGYGATVYVTVKASDPTALSLSPSTASVAIGDTKQLNCVFTPSDATADVTWSSSATSVARVSSSGVVTGVSEGSARITATTDKGLSADCEVTVYKPVVSSIWLSQHTLRLPVGTNQELTDSLTPANAAYSATVTWSSDASSVARVSSAGRVTAVSPGTAHITATTDNGCSDQCTVTVPPLPERLSLPSNVTIGLRKIMQLTCTVYPSNATASLTWSSSDSKVAQVSSTGLVTARSVGEAVVTVKSSNGLSASCHVTVAPTEYALVVWLKNGGSEAYGFPEKPVVTIRGKMFTVNSRTATMSYAANDILRFTLAEIGTAINSRGDANCDGIVNVADIREILNYLKGSPCETFSVDNADANEDGVVNIGDILKILNIIH